MGLILVIAAVVLFVLAALFLFGLGNVNQSTDLGLVAAGLACLAAAKLPLGSIAGGSP